MKYRITQLYTLSGQAPTLLSEESSLKIFEEIFNAGVDYGYDSCQSTYDDEPKMYADWNQFKRTL